MKPRFQNDCFVDLNKPKAAVEFHKMFKYLELLMIGGRIRTARVAGAQTPSDMDQVCRRPV